VSLCFASHNIEQRMQDIDLYAATGKHRRSLLANFQSRLTSEGVFRVFGMGDDLLGINALTLTNNHLVAIADPYM
jgi:hypothetical protein